MLPVPLWVPQFTPSHKWKHVSVLWQSLCTADCWCCSYPFISLLMFSWIEYWIYGHLSFLSRDILTPPVASVHCLYFYFTHTSERRQFCPSRHSYLSDDHVRSASSKLPVAGIRCVLLLRGLCPSSLLFDASITKKIMAHCPTFPAKVSKTPIRVNPLAYSPCGK